MKNNQLFKFFKGFKFAFSGIAHCIVNERNFRFHLAVCLFILIFKRFYNFSNIQNVLLFITIALVLSAEAINSAIEAVVDLVSPQYSKLAKIAKDTAASAVLINALISIVVGYYLFWDLSVFNNIFCYFTGNILRLTIIILIFVLAYYFVFVAFNNKNRKGNL